MFKAIYNQPIKLVNHFCTHQAYPDQLKIGKKPFNNKPHISNNPSSMNTNASFPKKVIAETLVTILN